MLFVSAVSHRAPGSLSTLLFETVLKEGTDRGEKPLPPTEIVNEVTSSFLHKALLEKGCLAQSFNKFRKNSDGKLLNSKLCGRN